MKIDSTVQQYLAEIQIPIRLSCLDESGWPVVLSLWYLFEDGKLYCATPQKAKVVAYLEAESRCAFEIAADQPPYCGLRGRAKAAVEPERGLEILERLLVRYLGSAEKPLARKLLSRPQSEVAIRLEPLTLHTWNFSQRMKNSVPQPRIKPCPE